MPRLFIALEIPELGRDALSQLQWELDDAHWRDPDGFHLTLSFLGDLDPAAMEDVITWLSEIDAKTFDMALSGAGCFGGAEPHSVWVGVERNEALERLQKKIDHRLRAEGVHLDRRKFAPHVTLASVRAVEPHSVHRFTTSHSLFRFGPFPVEAFHLYESLRGKDYATYEIVASFALTGAASRPRGPVTFGA